MTYIKITCPQFSEAYSVKDVVCTFASILWYIYVSVLSYYWLLDLWNKIEDNETNDLVSFDNVHKLSYLSIDSFTKIYFIVNSDSRFSWIKFPESKTKNVWFTFPNQLHTTCKQTKFEVSWNGRVDLWPNRTNWYIWSCFLIYTMSFGTQY
jgi:hypothetical protein